MDKDTQDHLNKMAFHKQKDVLEILTQMHARIGEYLSSKDGYSKAVLVHLNANMPMLNQLQTEIDLIKRIN